MELKIHQIKIKMKIKILKGLRTTFRIKCSLDRKGGDEIIKGRKLNCSRRQKDGFTTAVTKEFSTLQEGRENL
jgi:hypothetical protein